MGNASTQAVIGGTLGFIVGGPVGAAIGAGIGGYSGYSMDKAQAKQEKAIASMGANTPQPTAQAKPATLAQAAAATKAKSNVGAAPKPAAAAGTIGQSGPQGLTTPPQTANLTLLGGTK